MLKARSPKINEPYSEIPPTTEPTKLLARAAVPRVALRNVVAKMADASTTGTPR
jgi:hypothetical protein